MNDKHIRLECLKLAAAIQTNDAAVFPLADSYYAWVCEEDRGELGAEWVSIDGAPKDGTFFRAAQEIPDRQPKFYRCYMKNGRWRHAEYKTEVEPTHWMPGSESGHAG